MNNSIDQLAQLIWDYHHLNHTLHPSDLILALGSNDIRVAEYAADLYLQGFAPLLMFSGNVGALTKDQFTKPEAEVFADIALQKGVPAAAILREPESTNTGETLNSAAVFDGIATGDSDISCGELCPLNFRSRQLRSKSS